MSSSQLWVYDMAATDKTFYQELGARIAEQRKLQGLTQVQVAEVLGISQQTMAHYEVGRLRIAVALLPELAQVLDMSVEEIVTGGRKKSKPGPASAMQRKFEQLTRLPRSKQKLASDMLDSIIQQAQRR